MRKITSPENPLIREILKIKKDSENRVLIEGANLVKTAIEALNNSKVSFLIDKILFTETFLESEKELAETITKLNFDFYLISDKVSKKIADTVTPQGVFALVEFKLKRASEIRDCKKVVVLDQVQDPGNLGTIIRTSEAFGVDLVLLSEGNCSPLSSKAVRASVGSIFYIPVSKATYSEIRDFLKETGLKLFLAEPKAKKSLFQVSLKSPLAVVFGNESKGVGEFLKTIPHESFRIPHIGRTESLNVAISASVVIYEILRNEVVNKTGT